MYSLNDVVRTKVTFCRSNTSLSFRQGLAAMRPVINTCEVRIRHHYCTNYFYFHAESQQIKYHRHMARPGSSQLVI